MHQNQDQKSGLNMSRRIRRTPFTDRVEEFGVKGFTVVNHMLLPKSFSTSLEEDYWHLKNHVQIWDVSCQRQVEISGPDAEILVQKMTPRLITEMKVGQCFYIPLIDENAGMINDPVLLKIERNKYWLSIADSDVLLWAKGLALGFDLKVNIIEPEIYPLAIQGPKSEKLMISLFGSKVSKLEFFHFDYFDFLGQKQLIARSGYSKQDGFEIYFSGFKLGSKLWDVIFEAGKDFDLLPACPNLIERIEGGLLSYGNEFTRENNPYECNLGSFCSENNNFDYIGKKALNKIKEEGITKKIRGVFFDGGACPPCVKPFPVYSKEGLKIGEITSGIFSPYFQRNVGLAMISKNYWDIGKQVDVHTSEGKKRKGLVSSLPFSKTN